MIVKVSKSAGDDPRPYVCEPGDLVQVLLDAAFAHFSEKEQKGVASIFYQFTSPYSLALDGSDSLLVKRSDGVVLHPLDVIGEVLNDGASVILTRREGIVPGK
jgi:hypothetical protein